MRERHQGSYLWLFSSFCCLQMSLAKPLQDCLWFIHPEFIHSFWQKIFFSGLFLYEKLRKAVKMESHLVRHLMNGLLYWKESGSLNQNSFWTARTNLLHLKKSERGEPTCTTPLTVAMGALERFIFLLHLSSVFFHVSLHSPLDKFPQHGLFYSLCSFSYTLVLVRIFCQIYNFWSRTFRKAW